MFMYAINFSLHSIFPILNKGGFKLVLFDTNVWFGFLGFFFKLLFSLLLFTTQVVLELEQSSDIIPFLRELCLFGLFPVFICW